MKFVNLQTLQKSETKPDIIVGDDPWREILSEEVPDAGFRANFAYIDNGDGTCNKVIVGPQINIAEEEAARLRAEAISRITKFVNLATKEETDKAPGIVVGDNNWRGIISEEVPNEGYRANYAYVDNGDGTCNKIIVGDQINIVEEQAAIEAAQAAEQAANDAAQALADIDAKDWTRRPELVQLVSDLLPRINALETVSNITPTTVEDMQAVNATQLSTMRGNIKLK